MILIEKTYTSWTWERISRHIVYWGAWLLFYAIINSTYNDDSLWKWAKLELLVMTIKLPITYFVIYYLVPYFLIRKKYLSFFILFLITVCFAGLLLWALDVYYVYVYIVVWEVKTFWSTKIIYKALDLAYIVSLPSAYKLLQYQIRQEHITREIAEQKLGAELKLLKSQLQPHFLFNTLNNLYGLVLTHDDRAPQVLLQLSEMMSYMLYECDARFVTLKKEITNLQNYIALEKIRYGKRLDISFETAGDISNQVIAPLLLIPFVENAFKHGVAPHEHTSWVRINLWVEGKVLQFMIENSVLDESPPQNSPNCGIGLKNVSKRLELVYPQKHQLDIRQEDSFLVQLKIQLSHEMSDRG